MATIGLHKVYTRSTMATLIYEKGIRRPMYLLDEAGDYPPEDVAEPSPVEYHVFEEGQKGAMHFTPRNVVSWLGACGVLFDGPTARIFDGRIYSVVDPVRVRRMIYSAADAYPNLHYLPTRGDVGNIMDASEAILGADVLPGPSDPEARGLYSTEIYGRRAGGLYAFSNGILNTAGNFLLPFTRDILVPCSYNARYDPSVETCSAQAVVEGILPDDDTRAFFYEMVGYILFGDMSPPAVFVLYGPGETGKSALANMIAALMGPGMVSYLSLQQISQRFMTAELEGKRLNICGETGEGRSRYDGVDGELIKKLSDGQTITVEHKGSRPYSIDNTAKLLFVTNTIPDFGDTSSGMYRRLYTIPCRVRQDPKARIYDLMTDPGSLSWLVNRALDGYTDLMERGFVFRPSREMQAEATSFRSQDPFYDFLRFATEADDLDSICEVIMTSEDLRYSQMLYDRYVAYCHSTHAHPMGSRKFYEKIRNETPIQVRASPTHVTVDGVRKSVRVFEWKDKAGRPVGRPDGAPDVSEQGGGRATASTGAEDPSATGFGGGALC